MQTLSELIGKRIKEIRKSKNIKQVELANLIDIEPTNLSKIEKGIHLPKDETIVKIANALSINTQDLFVFDHIIPKVELINKINEIVAISEIEDLKFFYRTLVAYIEAKNIK